MKKTIIIAAMVMMAFTLSGCGVSSAYKMIVTKDPQVCDRILIGQTTRADAEKTLGQPVGVKSTAEGKAATYRRGYFTAKVVYDITGVVQNYECNKE